MKEIPPEGSESDAAPAPIPHDIADSEILHRRIHPTFVKPDGSLSSQAFRDPEMSVDRGDYRSAADTLHGYESFGISAFFAAFARDQGQNVRSAAELLNPAHALVIGTKSKSVARAFARAAIWVVHISDMSVR